MPECPHLIVRYEAHRKVKAETGSFQLVPAGWFCEWCNQRFAPVPSPEEKAKTKEK